MKGYNGRILRVDLTTGGFSIESPPEEFYQAYLGGRGFIIHTLLREVPRGTDPLGPRNRLIFANGPITGYLPGGGRNSVGALSPLTGGYGESEAGGFWGSELKRAGYDAIILEGASKDPVYLWIHQEHVEVRDASHLWGKEIADAEQGIQGELGSRKIRTAVIGPAGENLIPFASIANDIRHIYGRMGMGAVMGSKRLKAIALKGAKFPPVSDREGVVALSRWMAENYKEAPFWAFGTGAAMHRYEEMGNLPVNNYSGRRFPAVTKINAQAIRERGFLEGMHSCFACPMRCKKRVKVEGPIEVDPVYGGPEYETLAAFGSNCGIDNLEAVLKAHELCNRYGMDTIATGTVIAFAMECFEQGILSTNDTGGLELRFGNWRAMLELVEQIARQQGLGTLLSRGAKGAAGRIGKGSEHYAMHVKGEEMAMHDPRHNHGLGVHYSIHATGADHCTGIFDDIDAMNLTRWVPEEGPSLDYVKPQELGPQKALFLYHAGFYRQACNQLGLCQFLPWTVQHVLEALKAITGWDVTYAQFMKSIERGITLSRIFNLREGFSIQEDRLPERFLSESPEDGEGRTSIDPEALGQTQRAYFNILGWDDQGVPKRERLVDLGIGWAYDYLLESRRANAQALIELGSRP